MTAAELQVERIAEERCVALWRFEQLRQAGYPGRAASRLAKRKDVDLHLATDLVKRGCPVETALRIML